MLKAEKLAQTLLKEASVLHLATSNKSGRIANCALEFAEYEGKLYWRSGKGSEHSKNLKTGGSCHVCITRTNMDGSGEGIQSPGKATQLTKLIEITIAKTLLDEKIIKKRSRTVSSEEDKREYWVFSPTKLFYMNENNFGYDRIELKRSK